VSELNFIFLEFEIFLPTIPTRYKSKKRKKPKSLKKEKQVEPGKDGNRILGNFVQKQDEE